METALLRLLQLEVGQQCRLAGLAVQDLEKELTGGRLSPDGMTRIWYSIQAFLIATGNISKLLWPPRPERQERGAELRASLSVEEDSCLQPRTFRNHFEHFDERLEEFFHSLEPPNFSYIDSNVSPGSIKSLMPNADERFVMRHFDPQDWVLIFRGDRIQFRPLYKAICELLPRADREAYKGPFEK